MDLDSIVGALLRHKVIALLSILATIGALIAVYQASDPVYQARSSLIIVPPAPPTEGEASDPDLTGRDNVYQRFGDISIVASIVADRVGGQVSRDSLVSEGVDGRFEVALTDRFGGAKPLVDVISFGTSSAGALEDNQTLINAFNAELQTLQAEEGTLPRWMFSTRPVETPSRAEQQLSSTLRSLGAVGALGALGLLTAISIADTLGPRSRYKARSGQRRRDARKKRSDVPAEPAVSPEPPDDGGGGTLAHERASSSSSAHTQSLGGLK